jgi:small subunit ribosomal protein S16
MLVIRMQRVGRKGLPQYRIVVQDSQRTPTSGKIVKLLGRHNPHTKETVLDKELAAQYLKNGAQPSVRVARLLDAQGVELPEWFAFPAASSKQTKNPEKLRKNAPAEDTSVEEKATPSEESSEEGAVEEETEQSEAVKSEDEGTQEKEEPSDEVKKD